MPEAVCSMLVSFGVVSSLVLRPSALVLMLVGLVGCAVDQANRGDPLRGDAVPGATAPAPPVSGRIPPTSSPARTSTAALTASPRPSLSQEHYLGMDRSPVAIQPIQPISPTRGSGGNSLTWEQAQEMLRARGVNWQQSEYRDGQWYFRCSIPNPQNPGLTRYFEANAPDEISAVRAALERMDSQR